MKMSYSDDDSIEWTPKREAAALALAKGYTQTQAAEAAGVSLRTVQRWLDNLEFSTEVDRLSLMAGIASRAERLRIINRAVRQMVREDGTVQTNKDVLEWIKQANSETDGVKLDLMGLLDGYRNETD